MDTENYLEHESFFKYCLLNVAIVLGRVRGDEVLQHLNYSFNYNIIYFST